MRDSLLREIAVLAKAAEYASEARIRRGRSGHEPCTLLAPRRLHKSV